MSDIAFFGAIESGLLFALVAFGIFLSFRILNFPDLTVDGSFPLGAAVTATLIVADVNPWLATAGALLAGLAAGGMTAFLHVRLGILHLLASILTMIALYSINLRIMGKPNIALLGDTTVITPIESLPIPYYLAAPLLFTGIVIVVFIALLAFMHSELGLAMRATGANPAMARAQGIGTAWMVVLGLSLSNGLVAVAGGLFAQSQGSADVTMGVGIIVAGLASLIGGEALLHPRTLLLALLGCIIGAIAYRLAIALALDAEFLGLQAQDLNLATAVLVTIAILLPGWRRKLAVRWSRRHAHD